MISDHEEADIRSWYCMLLMRPRVMQQALISAHRTQICY